MERQKNLLYDNYQDENSFLTEKYMIQIRYMFLKY